MGKKQPTLADRTKPKATAKRSRRIDLSSVKGSPVVFR
jgi:hypothetical protein